MCVCVSQRERCICGAQDWCVECVAWVCSLVCMWYVGVSVMLSMCGGYVCVVGGVNCVRGICGMCVVCMVRVTVTWCVRRCVYPGECSMDVYDQGGVWVVCMFV